MASTIYGNIRDISRYQRVVNGVITLINGPISEDPFIIFPTSISIQTNSEGYFSCSLGLGDYTLTIGADQIQFSVTEDGGSFNIINLVTTDISYTKQPYSAQWNGILANRPIQFLFIATPDAPDISLESTNIPTGLENNAVYNYALSYTTAQGETILSTLVMVQDADMTQPGGPYKQAVIPLAINPTNVIKKRIWRNSEDGSTDLFLLVELDPSVESYTDNESLADFDARKDPSILVPTENTTAGGMYANDTLNGYFSLNGFNLKNRFRLPDMNTLDVNGDAIGIPTLDREINIQQDNDGAWLQLRYGNQNWKFRAADRIGSGLSFSRSDSVALAEYIGGNYICQKQTNLKAATLTCRHRPGSSSVVVSLEVGGVTQADHFTITTGSGEFSQTIALTNALTATDGVRWLVTTNANAPENFPAGIDIFTNIETAIQ